MSRRRWRRAWKRSLVISTIVRVKLRDSPSGRARYHAIACRVCRDPRVASDSRLIVIALRSASPLNTLLIDIPSSASSPRPSLARSSMMAASAGRFATSTRPMSRSYQRNAGTSATFPCRMPS